MTRLTKTNNFLKIALAAIAGAATLAYGAHHPKIDAELEGKNPDSPVNVIIQYKQGAQPRHLDAVSRRGGQHKGTLHVIKGAAYSLPASALEELANDPDVEQIVPDREVHGMLDTAAQAINAPYAWSLGYHGTGIGIAIIDSGVDPHFDLTTTKHSSIVYSQSFVPGSTSTADAYGHGTHVAVVAAGSGRASACGTCTKLLSGIAPNAQIVNLRVLDQNGVGTDSAVIAGIQKAISLKSTYNIRVINLSLGRPVSASYKVDPLLPGGRGSLEGGHRGRCCSRQ